VLHVKDGAETGLPGGLLSVRGWSADGRYVYVQELKSSTLDRLDASGAHAPEVVFTAPAREMECTPAGVSDSKAFFCAIFDFVSDVVMVENFDRMHR
jgi:hypothetical protein